jgi:hypothetical protein
LYCELPRIALPRTLVIEVKREAQGVEAPAPWVWWR